MIRYRFAIGAAGILGLGAIIASTKVLGEAGKGKKEQDIRSTGLMQPIHQDRQFEMKFSECRFTGHPLVTYKTQKDETYFALQLQPKLQANARMPRDILLLVDTSASQASAPLEMSRKVAGLFAESLQAEDRLSIMTISNDSKQISRGFRKKEDAIASVSELAKEYASGGTNLKKGISDAISSFESIAGRQRVLVFMGDGMSIAGPIDGADRAGLCKEMTSKEVVFFPVPIGSRMDPSNLHGLASGTGGICMRMLPGDWVEDLHKRLQAAIEVPVLYSAALQLPKEVSEVYPSKLPPLRSDSPTLVVGKLEAGKTLEYKLEGKQLGKEVSLNVSEAIPVSEPENYFLLQVVQQWKNVKETPALIQADRALAFAAEQNQVAVSDLKEKAEWALREDKFDAASRLFNQALEIDPQDGEAKNGSKLVQKLRDGKLTLEQIRKEVQPTKGETIVRIGAQGKKTRVPVAQVPVEKDAAEKPVLPAPAVVGGINEGDILKETEARRAVADQQATQTVDEIIRNANRLVTRDPDGAYEMLKRILDTTQTNPDLSPKGQSNLVGRIERALQGVKREGRRVKSDQDERLQLLANADARSAQTKMVVNQQERITERMRVYHNLMNQARELEASKQAQGIRQDMVNLGLPVPQAVNAAYTVGQRGFYLREMRDLQRIRDDRWLATLFEVERSHIPFPDEPEIVFPDASYYARRKEYKDWGDFSEKRKAKYGTSTFGDDIPLPRTIELKNTLLKQVRWPGLKDGDFKLSEVLEQLSRVYNLEFDINEKAFAADGVMDVNSQIVASADKPLPPVNGSVSTVLKKILARVPAGSTATFMIRRESIEITTGAAAISEKVVRIYPVADLVYPPPSAFNQQVGLQQATLYGQAGSFGLQQQAVQNQGFNNAIMAGGIGAIGGGGGGQGALGGLGGGLGGAGLLGGNAGLGIGGGMAMAGNGGNFGQNGAVGQQGQFGNAGSQFGQQGGNSSDVLITIIRNVVGNGDKDWATAIAPPGAPAADPLADPNAGPEKNQIGFYSTANALVIKGTSRVHTNAYAPVINIGGAAAGMGALDKPKDGKAIVENKVDKNGKPIVAAVPKLDPAKLKIDPQAYWKEALEKAGDNPSMVIAISDFLAMNRYFDHAADFLKANIRKGIVVKPWVYEALAIALRESGGSPAEIERAEVAAIDLEPADGNGFLKAANTMAEMKRYTMALAFCKQAAHLEPNTSAPFEAAIKFAELADDTKAMDWAVSNLMKQDWPADNKDLQELALIKSEALARKLRQPGNDQAQNAATASIKEKGRRDLVIKLAWQGDADLDLQVKEPVGSICNPTNTQTVGGGVFLGDSLTEAGLETYTAAEAFKGNYEIRVKKVWGKTLGDKAQVRIIHNQGTAQQHEDIFSIDLTKNAPLVVKVAEGRRTELAYVSPPSLRPTSRSEKIRMVSKDIGTQLRDIADPEVTGFQRGTSIASGAIPVEMEAPASNKNDGNDKILYQTRVQSFMKNAMDMTTQVVLSSDRRSMRVSVTPVFESTANIKPGATVVNSSVIPGGN